MEKQEGGKGGDGECCPLSRDTKIEIEDRHGEKDDKDDDCAQQWEGLADAVTVLVMIRVGTILMTLTTMMMMVTVTMINDIKTGPQDTLLTRKSRMYGD